jgi:hypothetical protein
MSSGVGAAAAGGFAAGGAAGADPDDLLVGVATDADLPSEEPESGVGTEDATGAGTTTAGGGAAGANATVCAGVVAAAAVCAGAGGVRLSAHTTMPAERTPKATAPATTALLRFAEAAIAAA